MVAWDYSSKEKSMYRYVSNAEIKPYKAICRSMLLSTTKELRKVYGITSQILLIGSGAARLVTRNGSGPFDLDYNLILQKIPQEYSINPEKIKKLIRITLDSHLVSGFSNGQDSTASITYVSHAKTGNPVFHFDLGIIRKDKKGFSYRLINDKKNKAYIWNKVMDSKNIDAMVREINRSHGRPSLRKEYLALKNKHLENQDGLPSYDIYAEAVNHIYSRR